MTEELLLELIDKHKAYHERYERLKKMYKHEHEILDLPKKEAYKPDNRLVVNYAKYIVDTLNGFFIGVPIKIKHDKKEINDYLEFIDKFNDQDDNNAELSKLCSIYGHAYEMIYVDEINDKAHMGITYIEPMEAFVVYDNSIVGRPMYGVRYYNSVEGKLEGSYSDKNTIYYFNENDRGEIVIGETKPHLFGDVPIYEYVENEEKLGAFEGVETLINANNKALSEKANDVEYFADAYLLILGAILNEEALNKFRDNRIINMEGRDIEKLVVEFLEKPSADETQENLIDRLEKLIFQISMVMNINDENFGTQSGIALKYKLQSMENLAKTKERKFQSGLNKRYRMIANTGLTPLKGDEWVGISTQFTRNYPANLKEESEIAKNLKGVTSDETALSVLSMVEDAKREVEKINEQYNSDDSFDFKEEADVDEE
ncbi:phage portal protein [Senegalia massiliensis]|uniref:Phage portal protein n=2 Tax=Senegalia massiliensis TaxID=1720316 RepID=A0A845R489_9CLOT|nr:phage portal protein [Senegalia massiliensis]NBI08232.1 phage portal protein [Senegalia massiliensis]